jgi:hypothetical protein
MAKIEHTSRKLLYFVNRLLCQVLKKGPNCTSKVKFLFKITKVCITCYLFQYETVKILILLCSDPTSSFDFSTWFPRKLRLLRPSLSSEYIYEPEVIKIGHNLKKIKKSIQCIKTVTDKINCHTILNRNVFFRDVCLFVTEEIPITVSRWAPDKEAWPSPYHYRS